ncbi:uncharacterized protein LOC143627850 [Bidens hawaiensis]|uniref:uncharacterized protein LOC143627850 n=1 Tax=Bidens hawaiensis TaxID=980011 RepID=UPI00404918E9
MREFFAYRNQDRANNFSLITNGGRLYQQLLVDAYTSIESERLFYIQCQQKNLRFVYTIEFQKRGLPHAHVCVFMHHDYKINNADKIDSFISAEIPNKQEDPELYDLAHINVEWCNQSGSIKYLFKYINKGPDRATAFLEQSSYTEDVPEQPVDEIKEYYDCRYVSACESSWRIFSYEVHYTPSVVRLPFHLPGQQHIVYGEEEDIDDVLDKASVSESLFTDWMTINGMYPEARKLPYVKDACYDLGLLDDDNEYIKCNVEASNAGTGFYLRNLFCTMLTCGSLSRPEIVWEKTWNYLVEDIIHKQQQLLDCPRLSINEEQIKNLTLLEIEKILLRNNSSLRRFNTMPFPDLESVDSANNRLIIEETCYDRESLQHEFDTLFVSLTDEQRGIYNEINNAIEKEKGGVFFVYGYGVTGKTFLWKKLASSVRSKGLIVLNVASSGIATLLLTGGRTAHSRFKIPINLTEDSICSFDPQSEVADLIKQTSLII